MNNFKDLTMKMEEIICKHEKKVNNAFEKLKSISAEVDKVDINIEHITKCVSNLSFELDKYDLDINYKINELKELLNK